MVDRERGRERKREERDDCKQIGLPISGPIDCKIKFYFKIKFNALIVVGVYGLNPPLLSLEEKKKRGHDRVIFVLRDNNYYLSSLSDFLVVVVRTKKR